MGFGDCNCCSDGGPFRRNGLKRTWDSVQLVGRPCQKGRSRGAVDGGNVRTVGTQSARSLIYTVHPICVRRRGESAGARAHETNTIMTSIPRHEPDRPDGDPRVQGDGPKITPPPAHRQSKKASLVLVFAVIGVLFLVVLLLNQW